jgi:hypothetical protein
MASQEGSFPLSNLGLLESRRASDKPEMRRLQYPSRDEPYPVRSPFGSSIFAFRAPASVPVAPLVGICSPASRPTCRMSRRSHERGWQADWTVIAFTTN